ncbi:MAG: hypothetical protein LUJ09_06485 [Firmicutes bacterium]|nr:hypothetical protein [Bacillota bacterium]
MKHMALFRKKDDGYIALEACIVIPIFIFFVLFMYGLIVTFMAQNLIGHAIVESTQSLALDTYATSKLTDEWSTGAVVRGLLDLITDYKADDPYFSDTERWYDQDGGATQSDWEEAARARFIGYFSGGDEDLADARLKALGVVNGLDGLDFSKSTIKDSTITIRIDYQLEYFFNAFGLGVMDTGQQASAKMWGASLIEDYDTKYSSTDEG